MNICKLLQEIFIGIGADEEADEKADKEADEEAGKEADEESDEQPDEKRDKRPDTINMPDLVKNLLHKEEVNKEKGININTRSNT